MSTDDPFRQVRHDFQDLDIEQQAQFLIEASASTLARSIEQAGQMLAKGLGDAMHRACDASGPAGEGPGPAEPETAQRQAPRSDSVSSGS